MKAVKAMKKSITVIYLFILIVSVYSLFFPRTNGFVLLKSRNSSSEYKPEQSEKRNLIINEADKLGIISEYREIQIIEVNLLDRDSKEEYKGNIRFCDDNMFICNRRLILKNRYNESTRITYTNELPSDTAYISTADPALRLAVAAEDIQIDGADIRIENVIYDNIEKKFDYPIENIIYIRPDLSETAISKAPEQFTEIYLIKYCYFDVIRIYISCRLLSEYETLGYILGNSVFWSIMFSMEIVLLIIYMIFKAKANKDKSKIM